MGGKKNNEFNRQLKCRIRVNGIFMMMDPIKSKPKYAILLTNLNAKLA